MAYQHYISVQRLRALMDEAQINMKSLSLAAGLGETTVRDFMIRSRNPRIRTICCIAAALNVHPAYLMGFSNDKNRGVTE